MTRKAPKYANFDGFFLPPSFTLENYLSAMKYQPQPNDVVVATYPKCGTTWMCQIVLLILKRGEVLATKNDYFASCPFLDYSGAVGGENMKRPGCIKTHLPFDRVHFSKEAKYIYVARHPTDCLVSYYHHVKFFPIYRFTDGTFDDFFEVFIRGEVDYGDYFDHLLSWYERKDEPNVFFTTYEAMKADHEGTIRRVADFLGKEYSLALQENDGELLKKVLQYSNFGYMKDVVNDIFTDAFVNPDESAGSIYHCMKKAVEDGHKSIGRFIRKGEVGEGKAILSEEQMERLKCRIQEKTRGTDVMSLWNET